MGIYTDISTTNKKGTRSSVSVPSRRAVSYNTIRRGPPLLRPVHPASANITINNRNGNNYGKIINHQATNINHGHRERGGAGTYADTSGRTERA